MRLSYLLPITFLLLAYVVAEGRDYAPPILPQGERYISAQLFGVPDVPAHMIIATMPSRVALIGERLPDEITVTKPNTNKRVEYDYGWFPEREFAKLDRQAAGHIDKQGKNMSSRPESNPMPKGSVRGQFQFSASLLKERLPDPLKPFAQCFVDAGRENALNPLFLAAISMHETGLGKSDAFLTKRNAMGVSSKSGPKTMDSVPQSIGYMAHRLANPNGYYAKCNTVEEFGEVYAPSKTRVLNDPQHKNIHWPGKVKLFMSKLAG